VSKAPERIESLFAVEMLNRSEIRSSEDYRKEHCNGDPFNAYKLGRQTAFVILERTSKTDDFKWYFVIISFLSDTLKGVAS
jgi:hypothetical protein